MQKFGVEFLDELQGLLCEYLREEEAHQAVHKIASLWGGQQIYVPSADKLRRSLRDQAILSDYQAGHSVHKIAKTHQLAETHVYRILRESAAKS